MEVLIIPDSFKGSLSAIEVAKIMEETVQTVFPQSKCFSMPFSDGGEGALTVLNSYANGVLKECLCYDALQRPITAPYFLFENQESAWIELSQTAGITQLKKTEQQPLNTSTWGTGKMIEHILNQGCKKIYLGLGGSGTQDLGTGIISALGGRFLDDEGNELPAGGGHLYRLNKIDLSNLNPNALLCSWIIACDVQNPLLGKNGTAHTYARQKGASNQNIEQLEKGGKKFAKVVKKQFGIDLKTLEGGGAAGGVSAGLFALLNACIKNGFDLLAQLTDLRYRISNTDLILTGEGSFDKQSLFGKLPLQIASISQEAGVKCLLVAGKAKVKKVKGLPLCKIVACTPPESSIVEAMENAKINLERTLVQELQLMKTNHP
jgi:glycerate kinase